MPIITLISDFGNKDPFTATVKGAVYRELNDIVIVDISHEVQPFDIAEGAFILKNSYKYFPKGTIHIVGVDSHINAGQKPLAALIDEHYFIAADNGLLSLICSEINPTEMVEITINPVGEKTIFPVRDLFVPVACHLARGGKLSVIGKSTDEFKQLASLQPTVREDKIIVGTVIYVDNYGNSITNISENIFKKIGGNREFRVYHRNHEFKQIYRSYDDIVKDFEKESEDVGKGMALFGSSGYLEIAIYKSNPQTVGSASTIYGLKKGAEVYVEFT